MPPYVTRSILWLVVHLGVVSCAQGTVGPVNPYTLTGCYELVVGEWRPDLGLEIETHALPPRISLDTTSASEDSWKLRPDIRYRHSRFVFPGFPRWSVKGDSVTMVWSNGFTPTIVRLRRVDGHLEGWAEAQSDMIPPPGAPPWPRASVLARRAKCPANLDR